MSVVHPEQMERAPFPRTCAEIQELSEASRVETLCASQKWQV
jgi:hypothetical protein